MGYSDMHHTGAMQHSLVSAGWTGMRHKEGNLSLTFTSKVNISENRDCLRQNFAKNIRIMILNNSVIFQYFT